MICAGVLNRVRLRAPKRRASAGSRFTRRATGLPPTKEGHAIVPTPEAESLVSYLLSLKRDDALPKAINPAPASKPAVPAAPAAAPAAAAAPAPKG